VNIVYLKAHCTPGLEIHYWNEGHAEVDFIIRQGERMMALEVKAAYDKITGLINFVAKYPMAPSLQLDVRGIPWQEFIAANPMDFFR
jgi:hypothetical protein